MRATQGLAMIFAHKSSPKGHVEHSKSVVLCGIVWMTRCFFLKINTTKDAKTKGARTNECT